jgi:DNA-binding transcriptional MerR regulator
MADSSGEKLTIDDLAQRAGMTVRNIRAHQSRGLLPPPEVRARTGYYGSEHLARIRLIQELQAEGFNLKSIQHIVDASNGSSQELLDFRHSLLNSFGAESPELATSDELASRLGGALDQKTLEKAQRLGLIRALGDDRYEVPSPTLLRAGEELVSLGVSLHRALAVAEQIERHSRAIAEAFVRLFVEDVAGSQAKRADSSGQEWARLQSALERLRPLAMEVVHAGFEQTMGRAVEREFEKFLER